MIEDEYEWSDDAIDEEYELSETEKVKLEILGLMRTYVNRAEISVKQNNKKDFNTNFQVLSRYISAINELENLSDGTLSPEEFEDALKNIKEENFELTQKRLRKIDEEKIEKETTQSERLSQLPFDKENKKGNDIDDADLF